MHTFTHTLGFFIWYLCLVYTCKFLGLTSMCGLHILRFWVPLFGFSVWGTHAWFDLYVFEIYCLLCVWFTVTLLSSLVWPLCLVYIQVFRVPFISVCLVYAYLVWILSLNCLHLPWSDFCVSELHGLISVSLRYMVWSVFLSYMVWSLFIRVMWFDLCLRVTWFDLCISGIVGSVPQSYMIYVSLNYMVWYLCF